MNRSMARLTPYELGNVAAFVYEGAKGSPGWWSSPQPKCPSLRSAAGQWSRRGWKDACRPPARIAATESGLVHSSVIVTGGNRQAMRRAIEANHDPSFWRQAVETERLRLRLLPGLLLS